MEPTGFDRKLIAILAADVEGYSRLMGVDEDGTLRRLTEHRAVGDKIIDDHRGRVVNSAGDGYLAEFASPVAALRCAVAIQQELTARNSVLAPAEQMRWRLGLNLGDVIAEGDNIFGEGVNVAARLQALADGGGISISGTLFDQVETKLDLTFDFAGEQKVKNISKPVRIYKVMIPGQQTEKTTFARLRRRLVNPMPGKRWPVVAGALVLAMAAILVLAPAQPPEAPASGTPTVAVMPFHVIGGSAEITDFSDGLSQDLVTLLSEGTALRVMAAPRGPAGEAGAAVEIGRRLGARYILDGSVRAAGKRIRVSAQLVDVASGFNLWGGRYDRELADVLAVQDEVSAKIVSTLAVKLGEAELERAARARGAETIGDYSLAALRAVGRLARETVLLPVRIYESLRQDTSRESS